MSDLKVSSDLIPAARKEGDIVVVAVRGEIDLQNSPELRTELLDLVVKHSPQRLVLNLSQVPYMDSSAIAVLVELRDSDARALPTAERVAAWTIENMRDSEGFFYYQLREGETVKTPFIRWGQAWMAYALAKLLEARTG